MLTQKVRPILCRQYGITDIPNELLTAWVARRKGQRQDLSAIAYSIARLWQRGLEQQP